MKRVLCRFSAGAFLLVSMMPPAAVTLFLPDAAQADSNEPPHEIVYNVQVRDQTSGQPVSGVTVEAHEQVTEYRCFGENCSAPCQTVTASHTGWVTTGADGTGTITFVLPWCVLEDESPQTWLKEIHGSFGAPAVVDAPGSGSNYILARWECGAGDIDQVLWVTPKSLLAEAFAPVLHRHDGYELQDDLGDIEETASDHSTLSAFNVMGQRIFGPATMPPVHVWSQWHYDSFGRGQTAAYWQLDIDDAYRRSGAAPGNRPLYWHVFPYAGGAVVQYWLWFNGNDLSEEWGFGQHEGDWEYAAIRVRYSEAGWAPVAVNLSEHRGGESLVPADCWWSGSNERSYADVQQGWTVGRDHPHFWVAANSHALYNRFDDVYTLDLEELDFCHGRFHDEADYNLTGNSVGGHGFFAYDRLVPMGDFWHTQHAHGYTWLDHLEGGPLEPLRFYGRFGESACDAPGGCADAVCSIIASFDGDTYQLSPVSPVLAEEPHHWTTFVDTPGRWGNANLRISFEQSRPSRCYLGEFATCPDGEGGCVAFRVPAGHPSLPGFARVGVEEGDVVFMDADVNGLIPLGPPIDGKYDFSQSRISGSGRAWIDVFPTGHPDEPDAEHLLVDIAPARCGTAAVDPAAAPAAVLRRANVFPVPTSGSVHIGLAGAGDGPGRVRICDVHGRQVWSAPTDETAGELEWDGRTETGEPAPSGVYLVFEERNGRPTRVSRIVRAR